jgi:pyrroloquinoline quinone (PQQ) biosynthesis protein C
VRPADVSPALHAGSADGFLEAYWVLCEAWAEEIFARPLWDTLLSGRASPALVLGWGVEFYHYVEAANEHMAMATAHCRDDSEMRQWLAAHYAEEYDHSSMFLAGLAESGLDREQVTAAPPLASTRALVNYLNELAISDVVGYTGVFGVMQSPRIGRTRENVDRLYDHLAALYGFARPFLESVRRHAAADLALGHAQLVLERLVARNGTPAANERARIVRAARDVTERFVMFFDGIEEYYGSAAAELPRRPSDVRGLL